MNPTSDAKLQPRRQQSHRCHGRFHRESHNNVTCKPSPLLSETHPSSLPTCRNDQQFLDSSRFKRTVAGQVDLCRCFSPPPRGSGGSVESKTVSLLDELASTPYASHSSGPSIVISRYAQAASRQGVRSRLAYAVEKPSTIPRV